MRFAMTRWVFSLASSVSFLPVAEVVFGQRRAPNSRERSQPNLAIQNSALDSG